MSLARKACVSGAEALPSSTPAHATAPKRRAMARQARGARSADTSDQQQANIAQDNLEPDGHGSPQAPSTRSTRTRGLAADMEVALQTYSKRQRRLSYESVGAQGSAEQLAPAKTPKRKSITLGREAVESGKRRQVELAASQGVASFFVY